MCQEDYCCCSSLFLVVYDEKSTYIDDSGSNIEITFWIILWNTEENTAESVMESLSESFSNYSTKIKVK